MVAPPECICPSLRSGVTDGRTPLFARRDGSLLQNFLNGSDGNLDFFVSVVEVRGEANTGLRAPVDKNLAADQLLRDGLRVGHFDGDGTAAAFGVAWRVD